MNYCIYDPAKLMYPELDGATVCGHVLYNYVDKGYIVVTLCNGSC